MLIRIPSVFALGNGQKTILKEYPDILTVEEVSKALGISTKTAYHLIRENKIEHMKVGRTYRIPKAHLLAYMKVFNPSAING